MLVCKEEEHSFGIEILHRELSNETLQDFLNRILGKHYIELYGRLHREA